MASLHPFRALRPAPPAAADVSSVPYDVVSVEEARQLAAGNPLSFCTSPDPRLTCRRGAILTPKVCMSSPGTISRHSGPRLRSSSRTRRRCLLSIANGHARADGNRGLLLGRRVRTGRHQEASGPVRTKKTIARHIVEVRANGRRLSDLSRDAGHRRGGRARDGGSAVMRLHGSR